jgi:AcrR family transcriptional regulator
MARREPRDTRSKILAAALEVFAEDGYYGASIEAIAARAGLTKGAVYYWFTDKDDLARDLQHRLWSDLATGATEAVDPGVDTIENLRRGFRVFLATLEGEPAARFFLRDVWLVPALDDAGRVDQDDALGSLRGVLERGVVRGELVDLDPAAMARVLMGAYVEATLHALEGGDAETTAAVIDRMLGALAVNGGGT